MDIDLPCDNQQYHNDRVIQVKDLITLLPEESNFFNRIDKLNQQNKRFVEDLMLDIMRGRLETAGSLEDYRRTGKILLHNVFNDLDVGITDESIKLVKDFIKSDSHQLAYLKRKNTYISPKNISVNNVTVGQYIDLKLLCEVILKNPSIVQSILNEQKMTIRHKFEKYDSELCCSVERQKFLLGRLRIELGIDDFSVTKQNRKFLAIYGSFSNTPIDQRLKRNDIFLLGMADRQVMKEVKCSVNQVLSELIADLYTLTVTGLPIRVQFENLGEKIISIKCTLSSIVGDNLGKFKLKFWFSSGVRFHLFIYLLNRPIRTVGLENNF